MITVDCKQVNEVLVTTSNYYIVTISNYIICALHKILIHNMKRM